MGNSILFIDSSFWVTQQRIAFWIISASESVQNLSKSVDALIETRKHETRGSQVTRFRTRTHHWQLVAATSTSGDFFFFFSKGGSETDGNTKQLPLLRSSWSFFLCGFSEQLEEVTCCSGKMDKRLIEWPSCRARREDRSGGRVRWISASSHVKTHKQESTMPYFIFFLKAKHLYARIDGNTQTHSRILITPEWSTWIMCNLLCSWRL